MAGIFKLTGGLGGIFGFWALGLIWGSNFLFMKWAMAVASPVQVVQARVLLGAIPIAVLALFGRHLRLEHLRHTHHFAVMAILAAVAYYYGFAKGTSLLPSGIAGALSGAIPLFSCLAAILLVPAEHCDWRTVGCLLLGFVGVAIVAGVFEVGSAGSAQWLGAAFVSMGSLSLGVSFAYARRYLTPLNLPAPALATYQLAIAALILMVLVEPLDAPALAMQPRALWSLVLGLGLLGTGLAYVIYYAILQRLGAVHASSVAYIPPVVALLLGAIVAGEPLTPASIVGTCLTLASVIALARVQRAAAAKRRDRSGSGG
jgi:drug/metabolite transporter (DMT)-like permease